MASFDELKAVLLTGTTGHVVRGVLIVLAASIAYIVAARVVRSVANRSAERATSDEGRRRAEMIFVVLDSVVKGGIICAAGILLLSQFGGPVALLGSAALGKVVGTIVVAWIAWQFARRGLDLAVGRAEATIRQDARRQRMMTLLLLIRNAVKYAIIFVAGVTIVQAFGVDLTALLAGVGILGLAVGFGSQNLVRDVVTGFFIIMEGQYAVGDSVEINGLFGVVEQVGLRITKIRDADGQLRFIPNGSVTRANTYTANYVAHVVNVPLPQDAPEDLASLVRPILDDFDREFRVFAQPPALGQAENLPTYARVLKVETHSIPGRQSIVESKLPARLTGALERAGHALPAGAEVSVSLRYPPPGSA
jgi:small conductance mechanosensitive channel